MSFRLLGPFPVELGAVTSAAQLALEVAAALGPDGAHPRSRPASNRQSEPGLYVVLRQAERWEIAGFWLIFGPSYLESGPVGGAGRAPPFVAELLNAATEAVWWRLLPVWPRQGEVWTPLIVLEWPPGLATRASLPPLGVPGGGAPQRNHTDDDGGWMEDEPASRRRPARPAARVEEEGPDLPDQRGLLTLCRGRLERSLGAHRGTLTVLHPRALPAGVSELSLEGWLEQVGAQESTGEPASTHGLGPPLRLGPASVAFPLDGWLTRTLDPWPRSPAELKIEPLPERDIGSRWRAWLSSTVTSTVAVLVLTLGLAALVHLAALPRPELAPAPPPDAPQPAMSVCSADHQAFVAELRCQVSWLAAGGSLGEPVCGDRGATARAQPPDDADLQAAWCGLTDRDLDGWTADGVAFSDLAASRACYNVLGHPYTYEVSDPDTGHRRADPDRFLRSRDLGIRALIELVGQLDGRCEVYRARLSSGVEGAIFATAIGAEVDPELPPERLSEPARLRAGLLASATSAMSVEQERCFRAGVQDGVVEVSTYSDLCGGNSVESESDPKAWTVLGGASAAEPSLARRYTEARFGVAAPSAAPWGCHVSLAQGAGEGGQLPGRWDLSLPLPTSYRVQRGLVQSQLVLDAGLRALLEDGAGAEPCWEVVRGALARYTPVYPLLSPPDPGAWPSEEQQVCGQLCAVWGRVRGDAAALATPGADLALCLSGAAPAEAGSGRGGLDALRLPWNDVDRAGWQRPSAAEICGFNLVAQSYFPDSSGAVLPEGLAAPQWAGSTTTGGGLAGGADGVAADSARGMSAYGRTRSVRTCGAVAAQCFASGLVSVTSDPALASYQWPAQWQAWLRRVAEGDGDGRSPWCSLIQPYLRLDGSLPEGQLDYPCVRGVEEARRGFDGQVSALAAAAARRAP